MQTMVTYRNNLVKPEGIHWSEVPEGTALVVRTKSRTYRIINLGEKRALISGHPQICPQPVPVTIHGSTWGGSMLKTDYIGRGMHLEFSLPNRRTVTTSPIVDIHPLLPTTVH